MDYKHETTITDKEKRLMELISLLHSGLVKAVGKDTVKHNQEMDRLDEEPKAVTISPESPVVIRNSNYVQFSHVYYEPCIVADR